MAHHWRILILGYSILTYLTCLIGCFSSKESTVSASRSYAKKYFEGSSHEVTVYTLTGSEEGPTLLIFAGIHGDEAGGYLTAERYVNVKVRRGTLIVVPRLNLPAITKRSRNGIGGDMNRLFHLPEGSEGNPDMKVVNLAKELIKRADYVLNLHQGEGFYSPRWISSKRNPFRWGQCNVIDAPFFDLPNGEKLELARFAGKVAARSNAVIRDRRFFFHVNNTNTASRNSPHKEQRKSLTYYALYRQHKTALGLESTKNCSLSQAISFLTIAVNSVVEEVGIVIDGLPSSDIASIRAEVEGKGIKT